MECPTVNDLVHAIGKSNVSLAVEYELCKMADLINVGGNLNGAQAQFIATQLVEMFPAENLADFKICFQRGAMGQYGEIFRMDGVVIRKWMEQYLEQKYEVVEHKLATEKENPYDYRVKEKNPPFDLVAYFKQLNGLDKLPGEKVPAMTREQILATGQSEPPKKQSTGAMPMTLEETERWYRQKYPTANEEEIQRLIYTGKK